MQGQLKQFKEFEQMKLGFLSAFGKNSCSQAEKTSISPGIISVLSKGHKNPQPHKHERIIHSSIHNLFTRIHVVFLGMCWCPQVASPIQALNLQKCGCVGKTKKTIRRQRIRKRCLESTGITGKQEHFQSTVKTISYGNHSRRCRLGNSGS